MEGTDVSFHKKCIVCDSPKLRDLKNYEKAGLCQCENCSMVFMKEIPTLQRLSDHYKNYSYNRDVYVSPITVKRYNEILDGFEKYRSNNLLLDVGCGTGLFLKVAIERGWQVYGTEYSEKAIEICESKGVIMKQGALKVSDFDNLQFDVITSFEVIEHINNPQSEMQSILQLMRPGGLFYCTTPNFNALSRYYLKTDYSMIEYPEHLSYYTPKTLKYLCKKAGLKPLKILTTGFSLSRLNEGINTNEVSESRSTSTSTDEQLRERMENNKALKAVKKLVDNVFTLTGTGYSLKGYFAKPISGH